MSLNSNRKRTVLIADDEFLKVMTLGQHLRQAGMEILTVDNGEAALELVQKQPVDALITDLCLPGLDSVTLVDRCKAVAPHMPVLIMTGYATVQDALRAMQAGAVDYLVKPISGEEVVLRLERALDWMAMRHEIGQLKNELSHLRSNSSIVPPAADKIDFKKSMQAMERSLLTWAFEKSAQNQGLAAQLLNIPRSTFQYRWTQLFKK